MVSQLHYERLRTRAKQQLELSVVLEPHLALKAYYKFLISSTLFSHLCAQHTFVGWTAKQQLELSVVLEPHLALKAYYKFLISSTLFSHLCAQHTFVGWTAKW